jgi:DNA-binding transcriptional LysR family regulator
MIDIEKIRIFYYVALEGSLLKASSLLGLSSPSISKHLADLENRLNVKLFIRKRRGLQLTEAGEKLFVVASTSIKDLENISKEISHKDVHIPNVLRILTTTGVSCFWLIEKIKPFVMNNPDLIIKIYTTDDDVDFHKTKADVGILPRVKDHSNVTLRKIKTFNIKLFASKEYLEKMGTPRTAEDLVNHRMISFYHEQTGYRGDMDWHLRIASKRLTPAITIDSAFGVFEAAKRGYGIITFVKEFSYMEDSDLIEVLPDQVESIGETFFVTRSEKLDSPIIKQLYDCLTNA